MGTNPAGYQRDEIGRSSQTAPGSAASRIAVSQASVARKAIVCVHFIKDVLSGNKVHCPSRDSRILFQGHLPQDTAAYVDVDASAVREWINFAHDEEKKRLFFFGLLPPEIIKALRED